MCESKSSSGTNNLDCYARFADCQPLLSTPVLNTRKVILASALFIIFVVFYSSIVVLTFCIILLYLVGLLSTLSVRFKITYIYGFFQ